MTGREGFDNGTLSAPHPSKILFCTFPLIFWGLFFFPLIFASCTHLSPISRPEAAPSARFPDPEALVPQWQPFAVDFCPGLDYFEGSIRSPRLDFWALRVDLTEPGLRIVVSEGEPAPPEALSPQNAPAGKTGDDEDPGGIIPSIRVSSFVRRYGCAAGINANPFYPVSGKEGEGRTIVGITLAEGVPAALPAPPYDALVFYADRRAAILAQADIDPALFGKTIRNAVGGFFRVLEAGRVPEPILKGRNTARHPRSAAGLSAAGTVLYLLVIDGRRPGSIGATEGETGLILHRLGASEGLNFDGGGSSALALRFPDGKVRTVNTPIHGGIPGRERGVASCLGIAPEPAGR
jgi:hypothetical protein